MDLERKRKRTSIDDDEQEVANRFLNCINSAPDVSTAIDNLAILKSELQLSSFDGFLKLDIILNSFEMDIYWILHLNGCIEYANYVEVADEVKIIDFIRSNFLKYLENSDYADEYNVLLSTAAHILLYIFNIGREPVTSVIVDKNKVNRILDLIFLQSAVEGILHPNDIQMFTNMLATISCSTENDAIVDLQVQQISRLLSHQICSYSFIPNESSSANSEASSILSPSDIRDITSDREQLDGDSLNLSWCSPDPLKCLIELKLDPIIYLKAFDRALRSETNKSPFDPQQSYSHMTNISPGTQSVITILFESASRGGLALWKTSMPQILSVDTIVAQAKLLNLSRSNKEGKYDIYI